MARGKEVSGYSRYAPTTAAATGCQRGSGDSQAYRPLSVTVGAKPPAVHVPTPEAEAAEAKLSPTRAYPEAGPASSPCAYPEDRPANDSEQARRRRESVRPTEL